MTDPITDMLNQIRNAQAVLKPEVLITFSKLKNEIANVLVREGFVQEAKKVSKGKSKMLKIALKYLPTEAGKKMMSKIEGSKRVSKPGQRIYIGFDGIKKVRGGFGISVISTPKGLMTGLEARKAKLGGEVICEIW